MRRRGWGRRGRGRGNGGGREGREGGGGATSARLIERLRELRGAPLREVRALETNDDLPAGVAIGAARGEGNRPVAIVAASRDGLDLLGWSRIAARRAADRPLHEVWIAAPFFSPRTRAAAERAAERGPILHLLTLPGLAEQETFAVESFPPRPEPSLMGGSASLLARVLRVIQGATAVTSAGAVHPAGSEHLVFVRGERVARVYAEGDGIAIAMSAPEHRHIHVTEANFPRWGVELHEWVVGLAQDPRLLEGESARREIEIERAADEAHAGVTARWLPWSRDAQETLDWVGVDIDGRPVLGVLRESLELADVPALVAGWHLLDLERGTWTPGATGAPRLFVTAREIEPLAREILEELAGPIASSAGGARFDREERSEREEDFERSEREERDDRDRDREADGERAEWRRDDEGGSARGDEGSGRRRRRRRRRRGGGGFAAAESSGEEEPRPERAFEAHGYDEEPSDRELDEPAGEPRTEAFAGAEPPEGDADAEVEPRDELDEPGERGEEPGPEGPADGPGGRRRGRRGRRRRGRRGGERDRDRAPLAGEAGEAGEGALEAGGEAGLESAAGDAAEGIEPVAEGGEEDGVAREIEATLVEGEEEREASPAPSEPVEPPPRARRQRAAILVRNEPESILAALVLARDRRTIVSFRVAPQEALMDFFKGPATDIADNVDVLVVGFTAQPRPREVLDTAELFRGRLQWFDHHDWAVEDVVRLRAALGRDSILIAENAASPLAAVTQVTERRSRFTDKLIDLSARRLSEADMQKWGYRVIALIHRLAATPGEHRPEIISVLAGKPNDLPSAADVYGAEDRWVEENDPRIVHFGEYQLAVCQVPADLDPGEVGRRVRLRTGARLSLAARAGDDLVMLSCNDEKRPLNVMSLLDAVGGELPYVHAKTGGDRVGRARVDGLDERPERIEDVIGGIVRHRSILYG